ncbi:MAG: hypothetical protein JW720_05495 [Sedimentisphaerales bacterium]|nr:hypothetical protein [Sedimentisphaerales bacterium]
MGRSGKIITVGLCPSWDVTCRFAGIEWGEHNLADSAVSRPAGKAMNVSRALAWMGRRNTAAGLWGQDDYEQMRRSMRDLRGLVTVRLTAVAGGTRRNFTVVDTAGEREMHLRFRCELVSAKALRQLRSDLEGIVTKGSICVFAGLMPGDRFLGEIIGIIRDCKARGARIAVDTYGEALRGIVDSGLAWLINPNAAELRELVGEGVAGRPSSLVKAARGLLEKVETVVVSRGKEGAVAVTRDGAWHGVAVGSGRVLSTVGCGDYLLGGFLKAAADKADTRSALQTALKVGTARAWGLTEEKSWTQARRLVRVEVGGV